MFQKHFDEKQGVQCCTKVAIKLYIKSGERSSGLIPAIPLTTIIKYTQLQRLLQDERSTSDT